MKKITLLLALSQFASASHFDIKVTGFLGTQIAKATDGTKTSALTVFKAYNVSRAKENAEDAENPANKNLIKANDYIRDESLDTSVSIAAGLLAQVQVFDLDIFNGGILLGGGLANFSNSKELKNATIKLENKSVDSIVGAYIGYNVNSKFNLGGGIGFSIMKAQYSISMNGTKDILDNLSDTHAENFKNNLKSLDDKTFLATSDYSFQASFVLLGSYSFSERLAVTCLIRLTPASFELNTEDAQIQHYKVAFPDNKVFVWLTQVAIGITAKLL